MTARLAYNDEAERNLPDGCKKFVELMAESYADDVVLHVGMPSITLEDGIQHAFFVRLDLSTLMPMPMSVDVFDGGDARVAAYMAGRLVSSMERQVAKLLTAQA